MNRRFNETRISQRKEDAAAVLDLRIQPYDINSARIASNDMLAIAVALSLMA
jgi:hypothetical protein